MESILKRIANGETLVADGAMGSLLMARAKDLIKRKCPEVVNLSKPEILEEIAALYLEAGADVIQTNTFGGSPLKLADYNMQDQMAEINRVAVAAVKKVVAGKAYVSASVGPSGKMLKPYGNVSPEEMAANFSQQIEVLIDAGADLICVETMTDINEATIAVKAAKRISKDIPVMATMTFDLTKRGFFTMMGVTIEKACNELAAAGADIIGSNCGNGIENMIRLAQEFKTHSTLPIIIQSNAGLPEMQDDVAVYLETPEFMAEKSKLLVNAGVSIIGGCCGTTPEHIRVIARTIKNIKK